MQPHDTPEPTPTKQCPKCKEWKPFTVQYFSKQARSKGGLRGECKACVNASHNPQAKAEYDRLYRAKNRERIKASKKEAYYADVDVSRKKSRERREKDREATNQRRSEKLRQRYRSDPEFRKREAERRRQWRATHPQANRDYYKKNSEKIKGRVRQWSIDNPERARKNKNAWRARNLIFARKIAYIHKKRRRAAPGRYTRDDTKRQYDAQNGKCYYCGCDLGDKYQTDHVVPLSRGGTNHPENIVIACPPCNWSKGAKLLSEWDRSGCL